MSMTAPELGQFKPNSIITILLQTDTISSRNIRRLPIGVTYHDMMMMVAYNLNSLRP